MKQLPPLLIFGISRTKYVKDEFGKFHGVKMRTHIQLQLDKDLDPYCFEFSKVKRCIYELKSDIVHRSDDVQSGHYYCYVNNG